MSGKTIGVLCVFCVLAGEMEAADALTPTHRDPELQADESLTRPRAPRPFQVRWAKPHPVFVVRWAKPRPAASPYLWDVARVESRFNPLALSSKGARGIFQLMPATARRFGLRVDAAVDERVDAGRSGVAAARYLNFLHGLFGDWKLALAAYNAGENRVIAAIQKAGSRDFQEISRRRLLPEETRLYVPKVIRGQ
jgi:membrane-bound lytic murein transglycosylase D